MDPLPRFTSVPVRYPGSFDYLISLYLPTFVGQVCFERDFLQRL